MTTRARACVWGIGLKLTFDILPRPILPAEALAGWAELLAKAESVTVQRRNTETLLIKVV